eukprot:TRINITY_DN300_c0_g1_i1.p1 TRINITY_DN300_c0_g1~~TRINITY_DN300_c0_g1_i1.p1  ORF type:complete len:1000 (-),score=213.77 TRINITY_DN300_c0_g1_i1:47-3046(-)
MKVWGLLLVGSFLTCLVALTCAQNDSSFSYVVSNLKRFQTKGGFKLSEEHQEPSLEATSHAVFLSSLFGLRQKLNPNFVLNYVNSLQNGDYGYGDSTGKASDLESVRHAILIYRMEGKAIPSGANVVTFLRSLWDEKTGLFANTPGAKGDLRSTSIAFEVIQYLNQNKREWVKGKTHALVDYLKKHVKSEGGKKSFVFPDQTKFSKISANFYGINLGTAVEFDFGNTEPWAKYIIDLQSNNGGFYDDSSRSSVTLEGTSHAVLSLQKLSDAAGKSFVDAIDADALSEYVSDISRDLRSAAQAHVAVAVTKNFIKNFETVISYDVMRSEGAVTDRFIQGTQLKPSLAVRNADGIPHAGLDVEVKISFQNSAHTETISMQHSSNSQKYIAEAGVETEDQLGVINFEYGISLFVVGVGKIRFNLFDEKTIGYGITIDPQASLEVASRTFAAGDTVAIGTSFKFGLNLRNTKNRKIVKGNFEVQFTVLDSSSVVIAQDKLDCSNNEDPIKFEYTLDSSAIPAGALTFEFAVADHKGVHSKDSVEYNLAIPMIATKIAFSGFSGPTPNYQIGETATVSIEPASFPDLRHSFPYSSKDVTGAQIAAKRAFFMDVKSPSGQLLRSVAGEAQDSAISAYVFNVPITASLDSIGTNVVSFRYITSKGDSVELANFDSAYEELYDDSSVLNYTVGAELYMINVNDPPKADDYFYGNDISFKFRVKDSRSGSVLSKGDSEQANVYLSLQHTDENRPKPFVSANEAAAQTEDNFFTINWSINPNAVHGKGFLTVSAQDPDGNVLDLYKEGSKKEPVNYEVQIGGEIAVAETTYSTARLNKDLTAFVVKFSLSCQERSLKEAQLKCSVSLKNGGDSSFVANSLPVATHDGQYSVSWTAPHNEAASGTYELKFFREIDRKRALENREYQEKLRRREQELKRLREGITEDSEEEEPELKEIEEELEPLFSISLDHTSLSTGKLPIRTEIIVALLLGVLFFLFSFQKQKYLQGKK